MYVLHEVSIIEFCITINVTAHCSIFTHLFFNFSNDEIYLITNSSIAVKIAEFGFIYNTSTSLKLSRETNNHNIVPFRLRFRKLTTWSFESVFCEKGKESCLSKYR